MSLIRIIYGKKRGVGKTSLNTKFAIDEMFDKNNYIDCFNEIKQLECEMGRKFKLPTQPHCVFSDYDIRDNCKYSKGYKTYPFNPYKFKLPSNRSSYSIFPPGSFFHINEAQTKYNSRKFKKFADEVCLAYESSRHPGFTITMDGLGLDSIDKRIRHIADEFIFVDDIKHEFWNGQIVKTIWTCYVCFDWVTAERFEDTYDLNLCQKIEYSFDYGNIFNCYKSRGNKKRFYDVPKGVDFEYRDWDDISATSKPKSTAQSVKLRNISA